MAYSVIDHRGKKSTIVFLNRSSGGLAWYFIGLALLIRIVLLNTITKRKIS